MRTWEETTAKARALGWVYDNRQRSSLFMWYKVVDGKTHRSGEALWYAEVETPETKS